MSELCQFENFGPTGLNVCILTRSPKTGRTASGTPIETFNTSVPDVISWRTLLVPTDGTNGKVPPRPDLPEPHQPI
jgi:hypothetical protein